MAAQLAPPEKKKKSLLKTKRYYARLGTNLATGSVRTEVQEGRECYVVPVAMIEEGVWEGSDGPILYIKDELRQCVNGYNSRPVVVYHPEQDGQPVSACDPDILNTYGIGRVFRHQVDNKLRSLAYLEKTRISEVDPRVEEALQEGKPLEVSTGFWMDVEKVSGVWNGKPYVGIAHNLQPDHLAILPDRLGAYSMKDGGGLLVSNKEFSSKKRKKLAKSGQAMKDGSYPIVTKEDLKNAIQAIGRAKNPAAAKRHIIKRARAMGMMSMLPKEWVTNGSHYLLEVNEMSFSDISCEIRDALAEAMGEPGKSWYGYIIDVFVDPNYVIFCQEGDAPGSYWKVDYSIDNGEVTLTGDPVQVERQVQYVTANKGVTPTNGETTMAFDKAKHIAGLIGNGYEETDRDELMKLPDTLLQKITPKAKEAAATVTATTTNNGAVTQPQQQQPQQTIVVQADTSEFQKAVKTVQDQMGSLDLKTLISNTGTAAQKAQFEALDRMYAEQKAQAIDIILNSKGNQSSKRFTKEFLETKELPELAGMADLCQPTVNGKPQPSIQMFQPNFAGGGGAPPITNSAAVPTEMLPPPSIDYAAK